MSAGVLIAAALQLFRQSGHPLLDSIWAEDGSVFLRDALLHGPISTFEVYSGYILVGPRLLGIIAAWFPLPLTASVLSIGAAAVAGSVAVYLFVVSDHLIRSRVLRLALGILVIAVPSAGQEAANSVSNIHWYLLAASFFALLDKGASGWRAGAGVVIALVAALSNPLVAVFVPLVLLPFARSQRWAWAALGVGLVVQSIAFLGSAASPIGPSPFSLGFGGYAIRVAASLIAGEWWLPLLWERFGTVVAVCGVALIASVLYVGLRRTEAREALVALLALACSLAVFVISVWLRDASRFMVPGDAYSTAGARYTVAPAILLLGAWVIALDGVLRRPSLGPRIVAACVATAVVFAAGTSFRLENARSSGPSWKAELRLARAACAKGASSVRVLLAPPGIGGMILPCQVIEDR